MTSARGRALVVLLALACPRAAGAQPAGRVYLPILSPAARMAPPLPTREPLPPMTVRWVGELGGAAAAVAVHGQVAYLGESRHLVMVDLTDPASPRRAGELAPFGGFIHDLAVEGNLLFVAAGAAGLRVLDLSDPLAPREVGALDTPGDARDVIVAGPVAYLADGPGGLRLVDVTDPAAPRALGALDTVEAVNAVDVVGGQAYLAVASPRSAGLVVADVADPARPREVGAAPTGGQALGVTVAGRYAYVSDGAAGLVTVDVADPAHPRVSSVLDTEAAAGMVIDGGLGYVLGADDSQGSTVHLWVADLATPAAPAARQAIGGTEHVTDLRVAGGRLYLADAASGLAVRELAAGGLGAPVGQLDAPGLWATGLHAAGGRAYVVDPIGGDWTAGADLRVLDLSAPGRPAEVARLAGLGTLKGPMASVGDRLFVALGASGVQVVDVHGPSPRAVGRLPGVSSAWDLVAAGSKLFVGDYRLARLRAFDLAQPASPLETGGLFMGSGFDAMAASADRVVVATEQRSLLHVVDGRDPRQPTLLGAMEGPGFFFLGLAAAGTLAYVTTEQGQLSIVETGDPSGMRQVGTAELPAPARAVAVDGGRAWVAGARGRLFIVDVSDPTRPRLTDAFDTRGQGWRIALSGEHAYLADGSGGLQVYQMVSP